MKESSIEKNAKVLMIVKPDGMHFLPKIMQTIVEKNLSICACISLLISDEQAKAVYREHEGKYYFDALVKYMTMGKTMVMAVSGDKDDIIQAKINIRVLAKQEAEKLQKESLCCFLGGMTTDEKVKANLGHSAKKFHDEYVKTFDGIHCSDIEAGKRELKIFFEEENLHLPTFRHELASDIVKTKIIAQASLQEKTPLNETSNQSTQFFSI